MFYVSLSLPTFLLPFFYNVSRFVWIFSFCSRLVRSCTFSVLLLVCARFFLFSLAFLTLALQRRGGKNERERQRERKKNARVGILLFCALHCFFLSNFFRIFVRSAVFAFAGARLSFFLFFFLTFVVFLSVVFMFFLLFVFFFLLFGSEPELARFCARSRAVRSVGVSFFSFSGSFVSAASARGTW